LFTGVEQHENFNQLAEIFPANKMTASSEPWTFDEGEPIVLPESFTYHDTEITTSDFLDLTDTTALLVIKDGQVIFENYWLTGGPDVHWMSFSVGKSFVSALIGIALEEGLFESVEEQIVDYVPELADSAYDGARIKDVLQMSSGARWNEDYSDPTSDVNRYIRTFGSGSSLDEFTATLVREHEPGTVNYYNSTDTQALGMFLARITGKSLAAYAEEKLWHPLGMENDAYWAADNHGVELAAGGLQVVARDYAKFGQLYLNNGNWNGQQVVSGQWVKESLEMDGPHLQPGASDPYYPVGYGYQWWILDGDEDEFSAIGIYNQFIYIAPRNNLVIVKLSAFQEYGSSLDPAVYQELETIELFRAIGAKTTL
jgi:CubicO group peptidase (beta-lactamase class C family)